MQGRRCVVTGATSGVGYQAARRLAQGGANLVLVCRNAQKASAVAGEFADLGGGSIQVVIADLSRLAEVRAAAGEILAESAPVHVLVNNAGLHNTTRRLTEDGHEEVFCVNHLASFLLTRLLMDRLKASAPARIIQVNSQGHRFGGLDLDDIAWENRRYRGIKGYGASKTAQLLTVWELAEQLDGSGVTINAMHPGAVQSNIGLNNGVLYRWYHHNIVGRFLKDPAVSGESIYFLAAAPEMEGVSGRYFNLTIDEVPAAHARDRALGKRVWDLTMALTEGHGESA